MSFFKPEDFHPLSRVHGGIYQTMGEYEAMAHLANKLLEERSERVYGIRRQPGSGCFIESGPSVIDTHTALLINIEELPKKECEHEPDVYEAKVSWVGGPYDPSIKDFNRTEITSYSQLVTSGKCKHCGLKLKAKWEVE